MSETKTNWIDYLNVAASSAAYLEASRAVDEVEKLGESFALLQETMEQSIERSNSERAAQKLMTEFIYQFNKTVTSISTSPKDPVYDYLDIQKFMDVITGSNISTSVIDGIENKDFFDKTLAKASELQKELEKTPQFQDYYHQQELNKKEEEEELVSQLKTRGEISIKKLEEELLPALRDRAANPFFDSGSTKKKIQEFILSLPSYVQPKEFLLGAINCLLLDENKNPIGPYNNYLIFTNERMILNSYSFWGKVNHRGEIFYRFIEPDPKCLTSEKSSVSSRLFLVDMSPRNKWDRDVDSLLLSTLLSGLPQPIPSSPKKIFQASGPICFGLHEVIQFMISVHCEIVELKEIGKKFYEGESVPVDYREAFKYLNLAAENGSVEAQYILAKMYKYGNGVEQNYNEAHKWVKIACLRKAIADEEFELLKEIFELLKEIEESGHLQKEQSS